MVVRSMGSQAIDKMVPQLGYGSRCWNHGSACRMCRTVPEDRTQSHVRYIAIGQSSRRRVAALRTHSRRPSERGWEGQSQKKAQQNIIKHLSDRYGVWFSVGPKDLPLIVAVSSESRAFSFKYVAGMPEGMRRRIDSDVQFRIPWGLVFGRV